MIVEVSYFRAGNQVPYFVRGVACGSVAAAPGVAAQQDINDGHATEEEFDRGNTIIVATGVMLDDGSTKSLTH
jgi:hypothetical protein